MKSTWILIALLISGKVIAGQTNNSAEQQFDCPLTGSALTDSEQKDVLAIEQLMYDWEVAVKQEDFQTLGSLVTEDAEFWTHETAPLVGRASLVAAFEPFLAQYSMQQEYQCHELIMADGWAFIRGQEINTLTDKSTGEVRISKQRAFSVLQKDPSGQWQFARGMTHRPPKDK